MWLCAIAVPTGLTLLFLPAPASTIQVTVSNPYHVVILFQPVTLPCTYQMSNSISSPIVIWKYKSFCRDRVADAFSPASVENQINAQLVAGNPGYNPYVECQDSVRTVRVVATKQGNAVTLGDYYQGRRITITGSMWGKAGGGSVGGGERVFECLSGLMKGGILPSTHCPSTCPPTHPSIHQSLHLSIHSPPHTSIHPHITCHPSILSSHCPTIQPLHPYTRFVPGSENTEIKPSNHSPVELTVLQGKHTQHTVPETCRFKTNNLVDVKVGICFIFNSKNSSNKTYTAASCGGWLTPIILAWEAEARES